MDYIRAALRLLPLSLLHVHPDHFRYHQIKYHPTSHPKSLLINLVHHYIQRRGHPLHHHHLVILIITKLMPHLSLQLDSIIIIKVIKVHSLNNRYVYRPLQQRIKSCRHPHNESPRQLLHQPQISYYISSSYSKRSSDYCMNSNSFICSYNRNR